MTYGNSKFALIAWQLVAMVLTLVVFTLACQYFIDSIASVYTTMVSFVVFFGNLVCVMESFENPNPREMALLRSGPRLAMGFFFVLLWTSDFIWYAVTLYNGGIQSLDQVVLVGLMFVNASIWGMFTITHALFYQPDNEVSRTSSSLSGRTISSLGPFKTATTI